MLGTVSEWSVASMEKGSNFGIRYYSVFTGGGFDCGLLVPCRLSSPPIGSCKVQTSRLLFVCADTTNTRRFFNVGFFFSEVVV